MAKFTTNKTSNKQQENTYILFMILGSYFGKCLCRTTGMEKKLLLYYKDMNERKQTEAEDMAIRAAENAFRGYKELLADSVAEAYIYGRDGNLCVVFTTGFEKVLVEVDPKGKYTIAFRAAA